MSRGFAGKIISIAIIIAFAAVMAPGQESYEDYNDRRNYDRRDSARRDKPLSELRPGEEDNLLDDLRGAVRDEIDRSISKDRVEKRKTVDRDSLIRDVKTIVKEEIEDAINLKSKTYLAPHTIEMGGFISLQTYGLEGSASDYNFIIKVYPIFFYFLHKNIALGIKGESEFNITTGDINFSVGLGPQFVFGLGPRQQVLFYTNVFVGVSMNQGNFGWRFSNELGIKIVLTRGVLLNIGVTLAFDTGGQAVTGFENIIIPGVGITAYF